MTHKLVHFKTQEFIDPVSYHEKGEASIILMNDKILWTADAIRDHFGVAMTINTWHIGGEFKERGFRRPESPTGAAHSQHKLGCAIDFDIAGATAEQVRQVILAGYKTIPAFQYINAMELGTNWVHVDVRPWNRAANGILTFYP